MDSPKCPKCGSEIALYSPCYEVYCSASCGWAVELDPDEAQDARDDAFIKLAMRDNGNG